MAATADIIDLSKVTFPLHTAEWQKRVQKARDTHGDVTERAKLLPVANAKEPVLQLFAEAGGQVVAFHHVPGDDYTDMRKPAEKQTRRAQAGR